MKKHTFIVKYKGQSARDEKQYDTVMLGYVRVI